MLNLNFKHDIIYCLSIKERLDVFKKNNHIFESSLKNIQSWKKQQSLVNGESFLNMLKNENVSEKEFNYAIKELNDLDKHDLYEELLKTDMYTVFLNIIDIFKIEEREFSKYNTEYELPYTIRPFLFYLVNKINYFSINLSNIDLCEEAFDSLINLLASELLSCFIKSLNLEIYKYKVDNELYNKPSDDLFSDFIKIKFYDLDHILNFYSKYPTLIRLLTLKTNDFINNVNEFLLRLNHDIYDIEKEFNIKIKNRIIKNINCKNNYQKNGKSVLEFVFGDGEKFIYKPRGLSVLKPYNTFIKWFNENSNLLDIPQSKVLDKGDYIFSSFIEYKTCTKESEVINYYKRYGEIIGLIYFLCGNDFHLDNIIANGEYPYIVDVETLIQSFSKLNFEYEAKQEAKKIISDSVLYSALLPFKIYGAKIDNEIEVGALSGYEQIIGNKVLTSNKKKNIPSLNNEYVDYKKYTSYIIEGFRETCDFIMKSKDFLTLGDGFINIFKDAMVRNILRPSYSYSLLLDYSYNPDFTSDFLKREKLMENLWAYPFENKAVIKYEVKDMLFDYIPIFYSFCNSRNLITSDGEVIEDYFEESGFDRVKNRIKNIDKDEIERQVSHMIVSFGLYEETILKNKIKRQDVKANLPQTGNVKYDILNECIDIAEHIKSKAIYSRSKDSVTWINTILNKNMEWEIAPLESSISQGLSGIALYFYELNRITGKYYSLYEKILKSAYDKSIYFYGKESHFKNKYSLFLPLINEYRYSKSKDIMDKLEKMSKFLLENISNVVAFEFMGGSSRLIQLMLICFDILKDEKYLSLADKLGDRLINQLEDIKIENIKPGMGYGASGISMVLFKLSSYINKPVYVDKALLLLKQDRKNYNFNDISYVNGSAGIGISRLEINKYYDDKIIKDEINKCLELAIESDIADDSLLYGNLGNIDFLLCYYKETLDEDILKIAKNKLNHIINVKNKIGSYGIPYIHGFETFNIYTGLAGIGYEFLRVLDPFNVPCILTSSLY